MSGSAGPGVRVFSIASRFQNVRLRCMGMTEEERQWRAQFLRDQILAVDEPRNVPEYYRATTNVIRRLWKTPMWHFQRALQSVMGTEAGESVRRTISYGVRVYAAIFLFLYTYKYHTDKWEFGQTIEVWATRPPLLPGDPEYPKFVKKTERDFFDLGFYSSPFAGKVEPPPSQIRTTRVRQRRIPPPPPPSSSNVEEEEQEVACPADELRVQ